MADLFTRGDIPEHLPGEPRRPPAAASIIVLWILLRAFFLVVIIGISAPLWPIYLLGVAIWGWPPNVPRLAQVRRYLGHVCSVRPPPPGLPTSARVWLFLTILRKCALVPIVGLAWLLDEALYGAQLRATEVKAPLLEISAGRSGSTQIARYLEDDPQLAAPSTLMIFFPYLWLWRLAPVTLGRILSAEKVRKIFESMFSPEFLQRHEGDPFRTETFESSLYVCHLNHLSTALGPEVMHDDFGFAGPAPHNRQLWFEDFVEYLDTIGRKTLLYAGPGPQGRRRFFVKGHFICAAQALAERYPDARFLTMIREPAPRLRSAINFLRVGPTNPVLGPPPWTWLAESSVRTETEYCEQEQEWFCRDDGVRRCVIRFSDYKVDLEGAMAKVYRECLDINTLPAHVPRVHTPRKRTDYLVDRSLAELRIDEDAITTRLADYIEWCRATAPADA